MTTAGLNGRPFEAIRTDLIRDLEREAASATYLASTCHPDFVAAYNERARLYLIAAEAVKAQPPSPLVIPEPGTGLTLLYPQDRYPYVVLARTPSGKTLTVAEVLVKEADLPVHHREGPWPVYDVTLTEEQISTLPHGPERKVRLRKDGRYWDGDVPFSVGRARYYRNYSY